MEDSKELRFQCTHCGHCCQDKNTLVNLTYHDILRLKQGLDLIIEEILQVIGFYVFEKPPSSEELKRMVVPPIQTENGPAFVGLNKKPAGDCYFYSQEKNKCMIYKIRPMFCRTFPFSFKILVNKNDPTKAKIKMYTTDKGYEYCPGLKNEPPLINEDEWIKVGKQTIEEMGDNNVLIDKWNEAVKNGKIECTAKNFLITTFHMENYDK